MQTRNAHCCDWDSVPVVIDLPYVARILGVTPETLKLRCLRGKFPAFKEGKNWRVEKCDLRAYIEGNKVMKEAAT